jgi:hypothetical protein
LQGLWCVGEVEQRDELVALNQGEDLAGERQVEFRMSKQTRLRDVTRPDAGIISGAELHIRPPLD